MSFKKNKYTVLKGAISRELADFSFAYFLNKRKVAQFLFNQKYISPFTEYWGVWNDQQVPNTYSHYSDLVMETLLQNCGYKNLLRMVEDTILYILIGMVIYQVFIF